MLIFAEDFEYIGDPSILPGYEYMTGQTNWYMQGEVKVTPSIGINDTKALQFGPFGHPTVGSIYDVGADCTFHVRSSRKIIFGGWVKLVSGADVGGIILGNDISGPLFCFALRGGGIDFYIPSIWGGRASEDTDYTPIESVQVPLNLYSGYHFVELYCDTEGAELGEGRVKVAIDGILWGERDNVINSAYKEWNGDPFSEGSYINLIGFYFYDNKWNGLKGETHFDSFYVCNEEMGYHDDFLGPVQVSSLAPYADGDQTNWLAYKNEVALPEAANFKSLQNEAVTPDGSCDDYVEAISHGERDLFYYAPNFDTRFIDLHGAVHAIAYKNTYTPNDLDLLKAIVPISKASGNDIVQEKPYVTQANEFTYNLLQIPYSIFPNLATPWTWELLENGQFGYEFRTKLWTYIVDEQIGVSEDLTIEVNP